MNSILANIYIITIGLLALLLTNLLFPTAIWADDKSCWLEASIFCGNGNTVSIP